MTSVGKRMRIGMKRTPDIYRLKYSLPARRVLAGATALFFLGCSNPEQAKPPPPEVVDVQVEQKDVPIRKEWIGTQRAWSTRRSSPK